MNSTLYALMNCPVLAKYFSSNTYIKHLNFENKISKGKIATSFADLFCIKNEILFINESIRKFKDCINSILPEFNDNEQHDAHEFLERILDILDIDLNRNKRSNNIKSSLSITNEIKGDRRIISRNEAILSESPLEIQTEFKENIYSKSIIQDLFGGNILTNIQCCNCQTVFGKQETFLTIGLPLPSYKEICFVVFYLQRDTQLVVKKTIHRFGIILPSDALYSVLENKCKDISKLPQDNYAIGLVLNHRIKTLIEVNKNSILKDVFDSSYVELYLYELSHIGGPSDIQKAKLNNKYDNIIGCNAQFKVDKVIKKGKIRDIIDKTDIGVMAPYLCLQTENESEYLIKKEEAKILKEEKHDDSLKFVLWEVVHAVVKQNYNSFQYSYFGSPSLIAIGNWFTYAKLRLEILNQNARFIGEKNREKIIISESTRNFESIDKNAQDDQSQRLIKMGNQDSKLFSIKLLNSHTERCIFCKNYIYNLDGAESNKLCKCEIPFSNSIVKFGSMLSVFICIVWNDPTLYSDLPIIDHSSYKEMLENRNHNLGCRIEHCLDLFTSKETIQNYYCDKCKKNCYAIIESKIGYSPDILIMYLKRFKYSNTQIEKICTEVKFPLKGLNLIRYNQYETDKIYDLISVINHHSSNTSGGHYTASILNEENQQWYEFNDDKINSIKPSEVAKQESYLFFYKLRNIKGSSIVNIEYQSIN